ncbi:hypothetical protein AB0E96_37300, partial [Kitasatospora sp. NPDC036755]|uniref:hypothetical protein n=1 Tax=Kitasatospora sp. NPDC036755 TaxID=3154600 RepID=UPI0033C6CB07
MSAAAAAERPHPAATTHPTAPWPGAGPDGDGDGDGALVVDLLDATATARPGAPAVRDADGAWSYAELARASRTVA